MWLRLAVFAGLSRTRIRCVLPWIPHLAACCLMVFTLSSDAAAMWICRWIASFDVFGLVMKWDGLSVQVWSIHLSIGVPMTYVLRCWGLRVHTSQPASGPMTSTVTEPGTQPTIHFPLNWDICFQQWGWPVCVVEVHDAQSLVASFSKSSTCLVEVVRACTNQYQNLPVSFYMCVQLSLWGASRWSTRAIWYAKFPLNCIVNDSNLSIS